MPAQLCLEPLRTIEQAISSLTMQSERHVLATLQHAVAALASRNMREEHITPATVPVLLNVLQLARFGHWGGPTSHLP
jgi:hypothetical protein